MSKIFRLYKEGATTYKGWNENPSFPYNSKARETIADPDGASAKNEITSIPSPFARIDLVKTAFKEVCRRANGNLSELDGNTIFHKMVSDTFDVGEIFFNIDKLNDNVEIITCDISASLENLKCDYNQSHSFVADSLEKFIKSDSRTYNFDKMNNIYLLNYKNGPDELNIIGATSPATFFFSGANNLEYINDIFFSNNDKPFDKEYQPLYKRDFDFVKVWWTIRKTTSDFSMLFPEIEEYLNLTFKAVDGTKKDELNGISNQSVSDFAEIDVNNDSAVNQVEVCGIKLLKKKHGVINTTCEFAINTRLKDGKDLPLVLPVESGNKYAGLNYVNGLWGKEYKAPYKDARALDDRTLPFDGSPHAYFTISDFLEDTIIRIPHALNSKEYFDGNIQAKSNVERMSYLLPIKPLYFEYFDVETLKSTMPNGKPTIEMELLTGDSIRLTLRIPIEGNSQLNYIEYKRIYYNNRQPSVTADKNEGGIVDLDFAGFVMPGVKFKNEEDAYYTVSCVTPFSVKTQMQFFKSGSVIRDIPMDCRNQQRGIFDYKAETYTLSQENFDYIRIVSFNGNGLLVPLYPECAGLDQYEFAVDLGTSNTHIEMKKSTDSTSSPLSYNESENVMSNFFVASYRDTSDGKRIQLDLLVENDLISRDFVPSVIGEDSDFAFPARTVLSYAKCINWNDALRVFGLTNFNITYNKRRPLNYNSEIDNIKWSNDSNSQTAMQLYIENLMLIIRNKVAVKNGNIGQTKITWFYPSSMSARRKNQLGEAWNKAYAKFFSSTEKMNVESESVAPIQYYFRRYATATNLVNVDIGGGTTDVALSENGIVKCITSFRFAANSLFEDSFSDINPNNGIVDYFKGGILDVLKGAANTSDLVNIFKSHEGQPANMASFLFSLKDNSATKDIASNKIDFNSVLSNDDNFKIVFVIFYTAIIYHIAQIVKAKDLNLPRHISFSGNGSKIIKVLTSDARLLSSYTKIIFEKVLGQQYVGELDILGLDNVDNPKEATCKGGLLFDKQQDEPIKVVLKNSSGSLVEETDTYASIEDSSKSKIIESVEHFFNVVLNDLPSKFNFDDNFGVAHELLEMAREECRKDLPTYLDKGLEMSVNESGNRGNKIEETLSFYPIKGVIQALSSKIEEYLKTNA